MSNHILTFFTLMDNQGGVIVRDPPKLDLELYIQNYRGRTRGDRLLLIGRSSVHLCVDALKAAVVEAKKGRDIQRYKEAVDYLRIAAPSEPEAVLDQDWVDATERANRSESNRLVAELKGYKNNLIKESIRMGNEDLGKFLENSGDLNTAAEYFQKMRPDVSTSKHIVDVGKHLVRVSIQRREWGMVTAHLAKMGSTQSAEEDKAAQPYVKIAQGIALLGQDRYLDAALSFLAADPGPSSKLYNEIASANDVAVYGGLLALATMDRKEIQTKVLDNTNFRRFLELEPHIRRAVSQFVNGRYSACITTLEEHRSDYLLDIYLQRHVAAIYQQIRTKCIVQYMIPYSRVSLDTMERAFGKPGQPIEEELVAMIRSGELKAKINSIERYVTRPLLNPRMQMQAAALHMATVYEKLALDKVRRMSLASADLELKGSRKQLSLNNLLDTEFDVSMVDT